MQPMVVSIKRALLMMLNKHEDFIILATNSIENFDLAFIRQIAKHIKFSLPNEEYRRTLQKIS